MSSWRSAHRTDMPFPGAASLRAPLCASRPSFKIRGHLGEPRTISLRHTNRQLRERQGIPMMARGHGRLRFAETVSWILSAACPGSSCSHMRTTVHPASSSSLSVSVSRSRLRAIFSRQNSGFRWDGR